MQCWRGCPSQPSPPVARRRAQTGSRHIWLETIITKSAEEVYGKFVNRFLLEEGCPKAILTDNGREFSSKLLRELMRLCRIRLKYTPPYHPRGNYAERANQFVGESLRAMANSPSGKKQDWYNKLVKSVQFTHRRMFIPGTNLTPYMVARGRQPISPNEADLVDEEEALLTGPSLDEHNEAPVNNLDTAAFFLFVVGPLGPPPSLARFASLESPSKCPFSTKQNGLLCGVGIRVWRAGPDRKP